MANARIFIVDDEKGMLEVCADTLRKLPDIEIQYEQCSLRAVERLTAESFDLLIVDIRMPEMDGMELLRFARRSDPQLPVLMVTAFPSVETAVESMRLGAVDYLIKPFLPEELLVTANHLLEAKRLRDEKRVLQRHLEKPYTFGDIVGQCSAIQTVFGKIRRVAETDVDVLIMGETGTGKELVAHCIHNLSCRRQAPFVPIDCGAIPENLMEGELLGYERGAFTGAVTRSMGLLELADGGTLFLDEIGELPLHLQAKCLRVLQERKFRRVGGKKEIAVNLRVIAATNRNLTSEVQNHRFRQDLYYRINVAAIELPSLRERIEDIPLLVERFVSKYSQEMDKAGIELDPELLEVLCRYRWPGNIRELQNVIKRALTMAEKKVLTINDLPDEVVAKAGEQGLAEGNGFFHQRSLRLNVFEKEYLTDILTTCQGDVTKAATEGCLPRGTLYRLLKKHGLTAENFRPQQTSVDVR